MFGAREKLDLPLLVVDLEEVETGSQEHYGTIVAEGRGSEYHRRPRKGLPTATSED